MIGDLVVLVVIIVVAGGGGIALGMLLASRLARRAEPDGVQDPEEPGADPDRA